MTLTNGTFTAEQVTPNTVTISVTGDALNRELAIFNPTKNRVTVCYDVDPSYLPALHDICQKIVEHVKKESNA